MNTNNISKIFSGAFFSGLLLLALVGFSVARINAQNPVIVDGNPTCADLNADNVNFPTIVNDNGFSTGKAPSSGTSTYNIQNVGNVTINYNSDTDISFSATSSFVTAVIVKAGNGANVYVYNPPASSGGPLVTFEKNGKNVGLSHLVFCYANVALVPTAATGMIAGRVTVNTGFVKNSGSFLVTVLNTRTNETQVVLTNRLGYYEFNDLQIGDTYVVSVRGKGYSFVPQTINLTEDSALDMFGAYVEGAKSKGGRSF